MASLNKIGFVASQNPIAKKSLSILRKKYKFSDPSRADVIVVLGGDGTVLNYLHKYLKKKIPIYGMNRGHIGFLMNEYSEKKLLERLNSSIPTKLYPLKIRCFSKDGKIRSS